MKIKPIFFIAVLLGLTFSLSSFTITDKQNSLNIHYFIFHGSCVDEYLDVRLWQEVSWPPIICEGDALPCTIVTSSDNIINEETLVWEIAAWGGRTLQIPYVLILSYKEE